MPTAHGSVRAIAVTARVGQTIQSLYTLMLQTIVIQIWVILVLILMSTATRRLRVTHNMGVANVAVWNSQYSPLSIAWSMLSYGTRIPSYALMWLILAGLAFSGQILVSSFGSPHLIVGQAAPVNPQAVFVAPVSSDSNAAALLDNAVTAPANLRAVNALNAVDPFTGNIVNISDATNNAVHFTSSALGFTAKNESIYRFDYSYNVTGSDFGLQQAQSLIHMVQGSCYTEYQWYQGIGANDSDRYLVPCSPQSEGCPESVKNITVSNDDAKQPIVYVSIINSDTAQSNSSINITFLFAISSVNRLSYTESNDPWFLTQLDPDNSDIYRVSSGRPFLNCWQQDSWSYNGKTKSIYALDQLGALSPGLLNIFQWSLYSPRIITLTTGLGVSALKAGTAESLGIYFVAASSSVKDEMLRLVSAAYIATKNTFAETTVVDSSQYPAVQNEALDPRNNSTIDGTGDFVVFGAGLSALSLSFLVSVPVVLLVLLMIVSFLHTNRFIHWPWGDLNAMNATILYSTIDSNNMRDEDEVAWKRSSSSPYHEVDEQALVRPKYYRRSRSYGWSPAV